MNADLMETQGSIEIDMVQAQERQDAGKGVRATRCQVAMNAVEMCAEQTRGQPASPLVEIAENDFAAGYLPTEEGLPAKELARLKPPLEEGCPQMQIEEMNDGT